MSKIESMAESQKQDREAELARNLRKADFDQVMAKVSADMEVLESQTSPDVQKQQEHALDMKYLRDRQAQLGFFFGGGVLPLALDHSGLGRLICSLFLALDHSGLGSWAVCSLFQYHGALWTPRQGKQYVDNWLAEHCHLRQTDETFEGAIPDFLKWKEQFRQDAGET